MVYQNNVGTGGVDCVVGRTDGTGVDVWVGVSKTGGWGTVVVVFVGWVVGVFVGEVVLTVVVAGFTVVGEAVRAVVGLAVCDVVVTDVGSEVGSDVGPEVMIEVGATVVSPGKVVTMGRVVTFPIGRVTLPDGTIVTGRVTGLTTGKDEPPV